jgi:hypothetical protein
LKALLYVIGETIGWFACVLGAAGGIHWLGAPVVVTLLAFHLVTRAERSVLRILSVTLVSICFGFCLDSLLIVAGVYAPVRWLIPSPLATIWLLTLWANFSLIVDVPLRWLQQHLVVAAAFGGLFGPAAYLGGQRLGAIQVNEPVSVHMVVLAIAWALGLALLMLLARRLPTFAPEVDEPTGP